MASTWGHSYTVPRIAERGLLLLFVTLGIACFLLHGGKAEEGREVVITIKTDDPDPGPLCIHPCWRRWCWCWLFSRVHQIGRGGGTYNYCDGSSSSSWAPRAVSFRSRHGFIKLDYYNELIWNDIEGKFLGERRQRLTNFIHLYNT